ncbi:MAG: hypothetical protein ACR2KE_03605, partial [Candidatus Nanopelagicales bacterium]
MSSDRGVTAPGDEATPERGLDATRVGWILVGVQALLLVALVLVPWRSSLSWPLDVMEVLGVVLMMGGLALLLI